MATRIITIGSGLVGTTLACALAKAGIKVTVIETRPLEKLAAEQEDGRVSAIAASSKIFLEQIGVWQKVSPYAEPIMDIRITDGNSPLFLHYPSTLINGEAMGYIVENHHTLKALLATAKEYPENLEIIAPARYTTISRTSTGVTVTLDTGQSIKGSLVIAADGRNSGVRALAGITAARHDYGQVGIVCNIYHEKPHRGVAQERFLPAGPFAILPMHGGHHSSLVWTEKTELADTYKQLPDPLFLAAIQERFGDYLGTLTLASKRFFYPLILSHANRYTDIRLALVGDAAHGIHPIAGQGYNLGIRGVEKLAELLVNAHSLGLDLGATDLLENYAASRRADNHLMIGITHSLNSLFSNNLPPLRTARRLGLAAVEKLPELKRFFMKHAMGVQG